MPLDMDDERTGFKGIGKRIEAARSQTAEPDDQDSVEPARKSEDGNIKEESDIGSLPTKKPIGRKLLIALGIIALIIYLASTKREEPSTSFPPAVQNPQRAVPKSTPSSASRSYKSERLRELKSMIDTNKARLAMMETELQGLESEIANLGRQLNRLKAEIKQREDLNIDNYDLVSEHNRYVPNFNGKLQEFNNSLAEYRRLLNETNAMVSEHNKIIRR